MTNIRSNRRELLRATARLAGAPLLGVLGISTAPAAEMGKVAALANKRVTGTQIKTFSTSDFINIKDYGAVGDGITNDEAAFEAFTAAFQGQDVGLFLPIGDYIITGTTNVFAGIRNLTIFGYGATLGSGADVVNMGLSGSYGFSHGSAAIAAIEDADAGDVVITLQTEADNTKFVVGDWVMVAALELQGAPEWPMNTYFNEYQQIAAIDGDEITLTARLKKSYKSTYPPFALLDDTVTVGPAAIYRARTTSYDISESIVFKGVRFANTAGDNGYVFVGAIDVTYEDCIFEAEVTPTLCRSTTLTRCTVNEQIEMDKQVEIVTFRDCHIMDGIICQSASIEKLVIENTEVHGLGLRGTVQHTEIRNSFLKGLIVGPSAFGISESLLIENSRVDEITWLDLFGGGDTALSDFTYAEGTLTRNRVPIQWAVPGANMMFGNNSGDWWPLPFKIKDVRTDSPVFDDVYVDTTLPDPLPAFSGTTPGSVIEHICPHVTVINSTGCPVIVDLSQAPKGKPFGTYARRLLFKYSSGEPIYCRGYLGGIRINVIRAYTGSGSLELHFSPFDNVQTVDETLASATYGGFVNAKIAGERVITPGAVSGTQSGDTLPTLAANYWFRKGIGPYFSADFSGETLDKWPIIEIEMTMSHGIVDIQNFVTCRSQPKP